LLLIFVEYIRKLARQFVRAELLSEGQSSLIIDELELEDPPGDQYNHNQVNFNDESLMEGQEVFK
jgi:hypothetical protein